MSPNVLSPNSSSLSYRQHTTPSTSNLTVISKKKKNVSFSRNASCPTHDSLINDDTLLLSKRKSFSTNIINKYEYQSVSELKPILKHHHRQQQQRSFQPNMNNEKTKLSFIQRFKQHLLNVFKNMKNSNIKPSNTLKEAENVLGYQNMTYFDYDDELDITEENELMLTNRLLDVLRESKLKHLNCGDLFVPCNHIKNISKQMLMMAAEEPFGIHGAKINIKLLSKQRDEEEKLVQTIKVDATKQSTFEIEIQLHEDQKIFSLRRFLSLMTKSKMKLIEQLKNRSPIYISPNCKLIKTRYYCHEKPKIVCVEP
ncbi:unnamed protein product [Didymodactylos carnosus]|uniref:Uncharacterized protein n=1 Tax=Didymodactylos carnosus TaxID=1234261 RepID=A0A813NDT7_9BILA|nr:unnamed protein product [Didymodactylos carnosus]CAF3515933.1 unnamed protein product [Didymodactylos carnosus]